MSKTEKQEIIISRIDEIKAGDWYYNSQQNFIAQADPSYNFDNVSKDMMGNQRHFKITSDFINAMHQFASQESDRRLEEYKQKMRFKLQTWTYPYLVEKDVLEKLLELNP